MKVIFLDVDGVLNNNLYAKEVGWGGHFEEFEETTKERVKWFQKSVDYLKEIVEQTGALIVMSSTWRIYFSVKKFKEMFAVYGWDDAPIIDRTPGGYANRGLEINRWLVDHQVDNYVILDDFPDFLPEQESHYVETDPEVGLTDDDAHRAITILNRSYE